MTNTVNVSVTKADGWKPVTTGTTGTFGFTRSANYCFATTIPTVGFRGHRMASGNERQFSLDDGETLYVKGDTVTIVTTDNSAYVTQFYRMMRDGLAAVISQPYDEMNAKQGTRFMANRIISVSNTTTEFWSVIVTGAKPVDLKSRVFGYTGDGVDADIFEGTTFTGGQIEPVYNGNGIITQDFDFQLWAGSDENPITITDLGTLFAPQINWIGSVSNQSKGNAPVALGGNYILAPNSQYGLRFVSRDPNQQFITAMLNGYNGELDTQ